MVRMGKVGRRALLWLGCMMGLWSPLLWAEVKVIPVFEAQAAVQTLKEIYPQLGVSVMGNQLVLSGTPAQLQEARSHAGANQPATAKPAYRVAGRWCRQRSATGGINQSRRGQAAVAGRWQRPAVPAQPERQLAGARAVGPSRAAADGLLSAGHLLSVERGRRSGDDAAGERPLCHGHLDWGSGADCAEQRTGEAGSGHHQSWAECHRGERGPGPVADGGGALDQLSGSGE